MASKSHATMLEVAIGGVGFFLIAQVQGCSAAQWLRPVNLLNPQQKTQVVYGGVIVSLTKGIKQAILKDCLRFHCHFCHKHSKCLHTRL